MVDREVLDKILESLQEQIAFLRRVRPPTVADLLADRLEYSGIQHELQVAIQRVLDIGAHILAAETEETPDEYREVLRNLGRSGVLPAEFAERIAPMAGFRNILVHEYAVVDAAEVFHVLHEGLDDLERFVEFVYQYLEKTEGGSG